MVGGSSLACEGEGNRGGSFCCCWAQQHNNGGEEELLCSTTGSFWCETAACRPTPYYTAQPNLPLPFPPIDPPPRPYTFLPTFTNML